MSGVQLTYVSDDRRTHRNRLVHEFALTPFCVNTIVNGGAVACSCDRNISTINVFSRELQFVSWKKEEGLWPKSNTFSKSVM